jgi:hypothetical protein
MEVLSSPSIVILAPYVSLSVPPFQIQTADEGLIDAGSHQLDFRE